MLIKEFYDSEKATPNMEPAAPYLLQNCQHYSWRSAMPISGLMRDTVALIKQDGRRFEDIRASVQRDKIFSDNPKIPIEEGDTFERKLPNGVVERYTVLDAGYNAGVGSIGPNYQSIVRKETKIDPPRPPSQIIYNLIGPNARFNIQSLDASTNTIGIQPEELFEKLQAAIQQSVTDRHHCEKLSAKVTELQQAQGSSDFVVKYREFVALAADHIAVLAPFIPALSQMLG
jgi:hypothetical protein